VTISEIAASTNKTAPEVRLAGEPLRRTRSRLSRLVIAIFRWRSGLKRAQQLLSNCSNLLDGRLKGRFVGFRGLVEAAQLSDELERRGAYLSFGHGRFEVEERLDISAHDRDPYFSRRSKARQFSFSSLRL
jgi:hypothetical protein